jgi:hypothetical protein
VKQAALGAFMRTKAPDLSTWRNTRDERRALLQKRGIATPSFSYTYFFADDFHQITRLFFPREREGITLCDLHDFTRFVEDFVLCDNIGIANGFNEVAAPHILDHFANVSELPVFDLYEQIASESGLKALNKNGTERISSTMQPLARIYESAY